MEFQDKGLGRLEPPNFDHVEKYPYSAIQPEEVINVEKVFVLPTWNAKHDQGREGACVGHGTSMMLSIQNEGECRRQGQRTPYIRYNPWWLWDRAKEIDVWPNTNPGDNNGTSVRAACEVLRTKGHVIWENEADRNSISQASNTYGIQTYRWATTIDEMRSIINSNTPVSIGVNWYENFYNPKYVDGEYWIGKETNLGAIKGGHCVCIYGASDKRQAFRVKNSWGKSYPEVWLPYTTMERLIKEGGEVALITDL